MAKDIVRAGMVIESMMRLRLSRNGNPRWRIRFRDGTVADTVSDAMWAYAADNPEFRGVPLTVTFTATGQIRSATPRSDGS
jgi:hypothetical protein